ncbi:Transcription factor bHLH126 like [Actinidia chinensis var. chinensis]|uniref:Transcription factor bHLH126 like n=1 Tax=Actinidia chinensis var. chinensis TaxID=1590841 RepID=A0A2R6PM17_ACTCC|nr:Transcription factor bHLH126 like [Actinidia chinensis var. chinensis]
MFSSLHKSDELVFQTLSLPRNQQEIQQDPSDIGIAILESGNLTTNTIIKRKKNSVGIDREDNDGGASGKKEKKRVVHREIERQRRQEMGNLYASLRTLLPLEYIKGKRSISDHMNEAVNYINHLRKNIKELEIKREKLKNLSSSRDPLASTTSGSSKNCLPNSVTVSPCYGGVEILVTSEKCFVLSKVFGLLVDERMNVVSYLSTEVNGRLFHTIRSEVSDQMYVDPSTLQQKLCGVMNGKLIESPTNLPMPRMG